MLCAEMTEHYIRDVVRSIHAAFPGTCFRLRQIIDQVLDNSPILLLLLFFHMPLASPFCAIHPLPPMETTRRPPCAIEASTGVTSRWPSRPRTRQIESFLGLSDAADAKCSGNPQIARWSHAGGAPPLLLKTGRILILQSCKSSGTYIVLTHENL
jgi:hypothetical protein